MKNDDCIFCKIIEGKIPSATIYENDKFKVILDKFPSSIGHVLVILKEHVEDMFNISNEDCGKIFELVSKIAPIVKEQLSCDGINILQNNGESAGQSVKHFHVHIIPRYNNDELNISWKPENPTDEQIEEMRKKLILDINI